MKANKNVLDKLLCLTKRSKQTKIRMDTTETEIGKLTVSAKIFPIKKSTKILESG